jgi:hypothetical protein
MLRLAAACATVIGALVALPAISSAAQPLALTTANLQQAINTPAAQLTAAQTNLLTTALQNATVTTTSSPVDPTIVAPPFGGDGPSDGPVASPDVNTGKCFGPAWTRETITTAGVTIDWAEARLNRWCAGPGNTAIVTATGWSFPDYVAGPYCTKSDKSYHGDDAQGGYAGPNAKWKHALQVLQVGVGVQGVCAGIRTTEDALRVAYNGYQDGYDDWGF